MDGMLTVGLCADLPAARRARATGAAAGWDLLVLPELMDGGYAALRAGAPPAGLTSAVVAELRDLSRVTRGCVVGGSLAVRGKGRKPSNTSLVFRGGRLVARYDKVHLFRPAGEHRHFRRGSRVGRFLLGDSGRGLRAGVIICYDLRFPEIVRVLACAGVRVLVVPARWPRVREDAWRALLRARAIENQIFVLGCNARGPEGGESVAFGPGGRELALRPLRGVQGVLIAHLRTGDLQSVRRLQDTLREAVFWRRRVRR